jgi:EF hand
LLQAAPPARAASGVLRLPEPPEATAKSRGKALLAHRKDKDGKIEREEILAPRRKAFAKLDTNGNGSLSFEEWADKSIDKFDGADKDRSGWLSPSEYATTALPPPKKKRCSC